MDTRAVFFIGKPGCGKGTQAKLLSTKTGWQIVAGGPQFRAIATEDTSFGHKVKAIMDTGDLCPYWLSLYIFLKGLLVSSEKEGLIFDGSGRRIEEAQIIVDALTWLERPFHVIEIQIADDTVKKRLALRKGVEGRSDDSKVEERLKLYHEYTQPAIDLFRKAAVLIEIDGEPSPEEIATQINEALQLT